MASGDNQTVDSLAIGDIAANWCFTHKSPFPAGDRGPSLMQTVLERDLWRPKWHCVIQCHEHPCQMASYSIQQPLQGARVWQTTYREIDCIVVTLCHSGWNLTWESLPLSRLSRLGRCKSSQIVSVPSRRWNFPLKSPPNFRIKVTTYSQNTVWTCDRQHASCSYILVKLVNSQFTSKQQWNYAIQVGSRPIAYTQWQRGLQPGAFTLSPNIAN